MKTKIRVIAIVQMLIIVSVFAAITLANENDIQWPDSWFLIDPDPAENGDSDDYRDVKNAFYGVDDEYLYFRLECYGSPNFTAQPEARYKWFIDIDDPHNMGQSGGNVYDAEYLLFVEDSPKPGGDGIGDIYLLNDVNGDGFFDDDWDNYLVTPGKINDSSIASYRIENNCMDICIKLTEISNPIYSYFTWATDQENPNLDQAPDIDRSNNYWDTDLSKADISIIKNDSADPLFIGESFTYSLLVTNHGPHVAYDIQVTDEIPEGLIFNGATPTASGGDLPNLFWDIPQLNVSESYNIIIDVIPNSSFSGIITNIAVANNGTYDPVAGNNQDTEETTVIQVADLSIKKTASVDTLIVGDELNYTLTVTNNGPHAAENVVVADILPGDVTFLSADPASSGNVGQTYNWNLALLGSGESFIIHINVLTDAMGTIINTAQVTSDILDQISNNNQDSVVTTVKGISDLSIQKTSEYTEPAHAGSSIAYYLNVTNHGPDTAFNVNVVDILPAGVTFFDAIPSVDEVSGSEYIWIIDSIEVDESVIIQVNVTVNESFYGTIKNLAYIDSDSYDPDEDNNDDDDEIEVLSTSDLSIEKTSEFEVPAHTGSLIIYTLNVTNHGPDKATNIEVVDILPNGVTFENATPMPDEAFGSKLRWSIPSIFAGESIIIRINVTVNKSFYGIIKNLAYIDDDSYDPDDENNNDDEEIEVVSISDLSIEKTSEYNVPIYGGDLIIYYINLTNHGPDEAFDVNVTDILPNGVTFIDSTLEPTGSQESTYWWIIASIDVNESVIIQVNVTVNEGFSGKLKNFATVQDDSYDPNDSDNEDDEEIIVEEDSSGGGGKSGGGGSIPPLIFKDPTAVTDGPYYAIIGEEIQFNATESYDNDENGESIDRYDWKFSDDDEWQNDSGAILTHTYSIPGKYNISLRVFDDEGASNINTTFALILKLNHPPSNPEVTGPQNGLKNVSYNFTFVSTDEDGDEIKYLIDWGDGNTSESDFLPSGIPFSTSYKWIDSGWYNIKIIVDDNETITTDDFTIEIIDPDPEPKKADETNELLPLFLILLLILIILILLLEKKRRDKKKLQQNPKISAKSK